MMAVRWPERHVAGYALALAGKQSVRAATGERIITPTAGERPGGAGAAVARHLY